MPPYVLIVSRGAGFSPYVAFALDADGSIRDAGHTFESGSQLEEALETIGVSVGTFMLEMQAIHSGIRAWIPLT